MADNKPGNSDNSSKKWSNPFKKIVGDVKKLIKSEEKNEDIIEEKPSVSSKSKEKPKEGPKERNSQKPEKSKTENVENSELEETEKGTKTRKAKKNEQKLPKKYRKGW